MPNKYIVVESAFYERHQTNEGDQRDRTLRYHIDNKHTHTHKYWSILLSDRLVVVWREDTWNQSKICHRSSGCCVVCFVWFVVRYLSQAIYIAFALDDRARALTKQGTTKQTPNKHTKKCHNCSQSTCIYFRARNNKPEKTPNTQLNTKLSNSSDKLVRCWCCDGHKLWISIDIRKRNTKDVVAVAVEVVFFFCI